MVNKMKRHISEISQVIKIKGRYFCEFGENNRVMTAHCLTGATLYQDHSVIAVFDKLVGLGKKPVIVKIGEMEEPQTILEIAEESHRKDISYLQLDIRHIKESLEHELTLEDYLENLEQVLARYINSDPIPRKIRGGPDSEIPF